MKFYHEACRTAIVRGTVNSGKQRLDIGPLSDYPHKSGEMMMGAMPYCWFWDSVYLQSLDGLDVGVRLVYNSRILKDPQFSSSVDRCPITHL